MDYLEDLFGVDTFNKSVVTSVVGNYLKYIQDMYWGHLEKKSRYEHSPLISVRE